jgi:hypothetical protein
MTYYTTLNKIRTNQPCFDGWKKLLRNLKKTKSDDEPLSIITILDSNGIEDAIWCLHTVDGIDRDARLFAVWCARQVQHLMPDQRSINALDVAERYATGEATDDELFAAWSAARDAAWDAANAAARAAESAVAWDAAHAAANAAVNPAVWYAVSDAARDAALDAAWDAANAAARAATRVAVSFAERAAAWDAVRDAQAAEFRRRFGAVLRKAEVVE